MNESPGMISFYLIVIELSKALGFGGFPKKIQFMAQYRLNLSQLYFLYGLLLDDVVEIYNLFNENALLQKTTGQHFLSNLTTGFFAVSGKYFLPSMHRNIFYADLRMICFFLLLQN